MINNRNIVWLLAALLPCLPTRHAFARTISASAGVQTSGASMCFRYNTSTGNVGAQKVSDSAGGCDSAFFVMPIVWETNSAPGVQRVVRVVGKRGSSSGTLTCQAINYTASGTIASQSSALSITSNTSYSSIDLVLNSVPAQSFGIVFCNMSANNAIVQGIDYAQ
jgi:hypothetical protein